MKKTVEVFRAGSFTSMNGTKVTFSNADIESIAKVYDKEKSPAPAVVGHPKHDAPAYGWADNFFVSDGKLMAEIDDLDPEFVEAVNKKRYQKISMAFFSPTHPANPIEGQYYPMHIGFLGGAAPAVSGLKTVSFTDTNEQDVFVWEYDNSSQNIQFATDTPKFSSDAQNEIDKMRTEFEAEKFLYELTREGKITPAMGDGMIEFMASLDANSTVAFANGEEKSLTDWFKGFVGKLPTIVHFGTLVNDKNLSSEPVTFNTAEGMNVDPNDLRDYAQIEAYAKDNNITFSEAIKRTNLNKG